MLPHSDTGGGNEEHITISVYVLHDDELRPSNLMHPTNCPCQCVSHL